MIMISSGSDFFAVGYKVRMPNIQHRSGSVNSSGTPERPSPRRTSCAARPAQSHAARRDINELSKILSFSDEVISHRSPNSLTYNKAKEGAHSLFKVSDLGIHIGSHLKKSRGVVGRHDCRGEPKRHIPCHLQLGEPICAPQLGTTLLKVSAGSTIKRDHSALQRSSHEQSDENLFLGRVKSVAPSSSVPWQEQTLTKVSSSTARHLVGLPSTDSLDDNHGQLSHKSSRQIKLAITQSYEDERETSQSDTDDLPQPNNFMKEMETGAKPVHQMKGDGNTIVLTNNARFNKVLQPSYPHPPSHWHVSEDSKPDTTSATITTEGVDEDNCVIGYRRWSDFPQRAKTPEELQWECQSLDIAVRCEESMETCLSEVPSKRSFRNKELFDIMQEWCTKWQIHIQPSDIKGAELILDDLHNLCDNTKMFAIALVAYLASNSAAIKSKSSKSSLQLNPSQSRSRGTVPPVEVTDDIVDAVRKLLEDSTEHVRVPSAVLLYCIDKQCEKAEEVLLSSVVTGVGPAERWASVQVLVCARVCSAPVISELLHHLHDSQQHQSGRRERAADLLARSSLTTPLVHAMLAEQLNSSGWQERLAACQMLPRLHGGINKDLCFKLVVLSWEDWSPEVRQAAAIALGQTGHGKMIHNEIANRLTNPEEAIRLDALKKLHNLHLMTPHLLPSFLKCFSDDHISVKIESIVLAGTLGLREPQVLQALQRLLKDPCWKVKAYALRAFANIGVADDDLVTKLLWAVRFEKLPAVRAEACHTIARLKLKQERVVKTLQDLLTVDDEPLVLKEVTLALQQLDYSLKGEDNMLKTIRSEVQRLGTRKAITSEIIEADNYDTTDYVIRRPRKAMTTRDYLNDKHRNNVFSEGGPMYHGHMKNSSKNLNRRRQSLQESQMQLDRSRTALGYGINGRQSWSPDRKLIDTQLSEMKKKVSMDVSALD